MSYPPAAAGRRKSLARGCGQPRVSVVHTVTQTSALLRRSGSRLSNTHDSAMCHSTANVVGQCVTNYLAGDDPYPAQGARDVWEHNRPMPCRSSCACGLP